MEYIKKLNEQETKELAKKEWQDERMQECLIKNYDFYKTNDDIIIEIEKASHLGINKTIWYDDELPADEIPSASYENFILENEHHCSRFDKYTQEIKKGTKFYFCNQGNVTSYIDYNRYYYCDDIQGKVREITKEEMQEILQLYKERKEAYIKRLERYFKRYGKHIHAQGYWANR